jgi:hypothetical protein
VYGLDIETDTTIDGLDPATSCVTTVALSLPGTDEVFTGPEDGILVEVDARLSSLPPGVIATWNGSAHDLPFLADRARLWGMHLGLTLQPEPSAPACYRAVWHRHGHVDAFRLYRDDVDLTIEVQHAHATSDARLARVLTERRWSTAVRFVDRLAPAAHHVA